MTPDAEGEEVPPVKTTALELFLIFSGIGLSSFGGGVSGWFLREFVQRRHWMSEEEFLNGLALSQALPGVNVKNMAIWIGFRMLGFRGAVAGFCGIIVPPAIVILLLGILFSQLLVFPVTRIVLQGAAAAAIGLPASVGLTAARRVRRTALPLVMMAGTFFAVAVFRLPIVWVVIVAGGISVVAEYRRLGRS